MSSRCSTVNVRLRTPDAGNARGSASGSPNIPSMSKSKHATKVGVVGSNPVIATT